MIVPFLCGALFAIGLTISGMTIPAKVIAFLDVGGGWDPSLILVMGAAVAVYLPVYLVARRRRPELAPQSRTLDGRLVGGAALFGVGWGLIGYCPGPALASLASGRGPILFTVGLVVGMLVYERAPRRVEAPPDERG